MSQAVSFPAYRGEKIPREVLLTTSRSYKKYYDTFISHDEKGKPREGTDLG